MLILIASTNKTHSKEAKASLFVRESLWVEQFHPWFFTLRFLFPFFSHWISGFTWEFPLRKLNWLWMPFHADFNPEYFLRKLFFEHQLIQVIWCSCSYFKGDPLASLAVSFTIITCSRFSAAQSRPRCIINREALLPLLLGRRLKHSLQTLWDLGCFMPVRSVHTDCFKRQRASCRPDHRGPCAAMNRVCVCVCVPELATQSLGDTTHYTVFYVFTIAL